MSFFSLIGVCFTKCINAQCSYCSQSYFRWNVTKNRNLYMCNNCSCTKCQLNKKVVNGLCNDCICSKCKTEETYSNLKFCLNCLCLKCEQSVKSGNSEYCLKCVCAKCKIYQVYGNSSLCINCSCQSCKKHVKFDKTFFCRSCLCDQCNKNNKISGLIYCKDCKCDRCDKNYWTYKHIKSCKNCLCIKCKKQISMNYVNKCQNCLPPPYENIIGNWVFTKDYTINQKTFGWFICPFKHEWKSAHTHKTYGQICNKCDNDEYIKASYMWINDSSERMKRNRDVDDKPHLTDLCQACKLGRCILNRNNY
jgi:hypothetical protein